MKSKFFTLFAAFVLLFSAQASAQTNGDVNGDGKVDEQDIAAILEIMAEAGGVKEKTKYYWYVGQENPASIDTSNLKEASNEAGWHLIGTSTNGFTLTFNRDNFIEFDEKKQYYLVIPNGLTVYAADGVTIHATLLETTSNIPNHKTYVSKGATYEVQGVVIK